MTPNLSLHHETLRCPNCHLVQFRTKTDLCRRCQQFLETPLRSAHPYICPAAGIEPSPESLAQRIGAAIQFHRKQQRLSQQQLAKTMRTSRSYISKLERGQLVPTLNTLHRAAQALGLKLADLLLDLSSRHLSP